MILSHKDLILCLQLWHAAHLRGDDVQFLSDSALFLSSYRWLPARPRVLHAPPHAPVRRSCTQDITTQLLRLHLVAWCEFVAMSGLPRRAGIAQRAMGKTSVFFVQLYSSARDVHLQAMMRRARERTHSAQAISAPERPQARHTPPFSGSTRHHARIRVEWALLSHALRCQQAAPSRKMLALRWGVRSLQSHWQPQQLQRRRGRVAHTPQSTHPPAACRVRL